MRKSELYTDLDISGEKNSQRTEGKKRKRERQREREIKSEKEREREREREREMKSGLRERFREHGMEIAKGTKILKKSELYTDIDISGKKYQ